MKIKVCGMRDPQNIIRLAELKPDYMGLIFYPKSKRFAENPDKNVLASLPDTIRLTGVFVNEQEEMILKKVIDYNLKAVQLHGAESPEFCFKLKRSLKEKLPQNKVELIKAFGIHPGFDFSDLIPYDAAVDYYLFDTKTAEHGGSGVPFDWAILHQYQGQKPFFLSGGLSPDNIGRLRNLAVENLYALDLNSRFETEPGIKDIESLKSVFQLFRES